MILVYAVFYFYIWIDYLERVWFCPFSYVVLHLPKPQIEKLCKICCYILSHSDQYSETIFSFTLSLISNLIQLAENMEWFVRNNLILLISELFNSYSCTVTMCRYFIVILNQIAADGLYSNWNWLLGKHIDALAKWIGFSLIKNNIEVFASSANTNDSHRQIVELSFVYLLRVFVQNTKKTIEENQSEVTELLSFLYEALFSQNYINYTPSENDSADNRLILSVHYSDQNVLMEYVMSLFALLCYNCACSFLFSWIAEQPSIVQDSTVSHLCQRINKVSNMNVVLFLHQFLYFCISTNRTISTGMISSLAD